MKNLALISFLLLTAFFTSCDLLESSEDDVQLDLEFDLSGAQAIMLQNSSSNGRVSGTTTNLFKVDTEGNVSPVVDDVSVYLVRTLPKGLYIEIYVGSNRKRFYALFDNSFTEIKEKVGNYFLGANENGDLVFSDFSIFRFDSKTIEKPQTTLSDPSVQSLSRNLAVITDYSIFQVFNTVSNVRYNIQGCNGPQVEAFMGNEKALVNDCTNEAIMDMTDGSRTGIEEFSQWNHETLPLEEGIIVLTQGRGGSNFYGLSLVTAEGNRTFLTDDIFQPGSTTCSNCGDPNTVLYGAEQFLVIRELNKVSVVDRNNNNIVTSILDGLNVTNISLEGTLVYYLAEDNMGTPITGVYDLSNGENTVLDNQTQYDDIQTF
ncbi:hypothetical protein [Sediminitomix flava]|uniref:TolB-like protein n=1 Tax=Sediminitomix flava TaxID=379075 RepID=A0A315Z9J8_SEDFL|nr:hypothetical protein [Sediminitomix flava]PWJ41099.1 hypothetical protein BC781_104374 [Sediminitomix flava]